MRNRLVIPTRAKVAFVAATVAIVGGYGVSRAGNDSVVGEYICRAMGSKPCDTHIALRLQSNGYWGWAKYSGQYEVRNGSVEFVNGSGGPVSWGPATIGPNTLSFQSGGESVVWKK